MNEMLPNTNSYIRTNKKKQKLNKKNETINNILPQILINSNSNNNTS